MIQERTRKKNHSKRDAEEYDEPVEKKWVSPRLLKVKPQEKPFKKDKEARNLGSSLSRSISEICKKTYLGELSPIEIMSCIEFENEDVVDLSTCPYTTVETEKKKE